MTTHFTKYQPLIKLIFMKRAHIFCLNYIKSWHIGIKAIKKTKKSNNSYQNNLKRVQCTFVVQPPRTKAKNGNLNANFSCESSATPGNALKKLLNKYIKKWANLLLLGSSAAHFRYLSQPRLNSFILTFCQFRVLRNQFKRNQNTKSDNKACFVLKWERANLKKFKDER